MIARLLALSAALLGSLSPQDAAKKSSIVLVSGEFEYKSAETLPAFRKHLESGHPFACTVLQRTQGEDIPGLEALDRADLAVFFIRRMTLPPEQLDRVRKYLDSGKPLVALRTSSHAFQNWKEFDRDVLGGHYGNHYGNKLATTVRVEPKAADHPILRGVPKEFPSAGSLYKTSPLAAGAVPLLLGRVEGKPEEPAAWTNSFKGARVFYTSLGHPQDFESEAFRRLLTNALYWALGREIPPPPAEKGRSDPPRGAARLAYLGQDAAPLPGTKPLEAQGDLAAEMVAGIDRFLTRELAASVAGRKRFYRPDFDNDDAYMRSVEPNRQRLRKILGAVDPRKEVTALDYVSSTDSPSEAGRGQGYTVHAVRWPVFEGVDAEGLLLKPVEKEFARVVAIPDADVPPEQIAGLAAGLPAEAQYARRLAESGCLVLVPVLIDRQDEESGHPAFRFTNQPHREWIYRAAYELGRHIIGYEVQKILAAVDWLALYIGVDEPPIAVVGHGEGGLLALYAAAADHRIFGALVSGYFQEREGLWQEPIYRNVWGLLREFGDAELAAMIAPKALVIETGTGPAVEGPPEPREGRRGAAPGRLVPPPAESARRELERARSVYERLGAGGQLRIVAAPEGTGPGISQEALAELLKCKPFKRKLKPPGNAPLDQRHSFEPSARLRRQFRQLVDHTQNVYRESESAREKYWAKADRSSAEKFARSAQEYRDRLWEEVIGKLPAPEVPPNPRARQAYDEPRWRGYEVALDVYPDVFAYGVLLVPRDLKPGERRPVVVCQHGLEGRSQDTIAREGRPFQYYKAFAAQLAERGFVTYAPQNPYLGGDKFRVLQRKANPLGLSLFSFIVRQHERTLDWLGSLPFVDPKRIGFYGLSYGGKTAVRVPPILADRYALSICSADYNEWILKNVSVSSRYSYMFTGEYEMPEFDLGNTFNYAELAALMVPRPFMVERGHDDGVAPDEWVAYEYAKVRRLYDRLGIGDRTAIEFFNGPHAIHGAGTFEFLHRHLDWPAPK